MQAREIDAGPDVGADEDLSRVDVMDWDDGGGCPCDDDKRGSAEDGPEHRCGGEMDFLGEDGAKHGNGGIGQDFGE